MKALIVGEEAAGALADSYGRAFRALGWQAARFCDIRAWREMLPGADTRLAHGPLARALAPVYNRWLRKNLQPRVRDVDLVLVVKGRHLSKRTVKWLKAHFRAPVLNIYPDDPFSSRRSVRPTYGPEMLAAYDHCFTYARHLIPAYGRVGVRSVSYLPFARDPDLQAPVEGGGDPEFDLVFVGNCNDPERVRLLEMGSAFRLAVFGEARPRKSPFRSALRRVNFFGPAYGKAMARALSRGKISLNLMRPQNRLSHNMRSFESPACGAFTLSQRTPELGRLFKEGEEIACFETRQEFREEVEHWLQNDVGRARIARQGFLRVKNDTYERRVRSILAAIGIGT